MVVAEATVAPGAEPSSVAYGGDRGRLVIAQRAVERIAEITARRHGAVVRRDSVLGRGLPKARAIVAGRRTRIELQVAAAWGRPLEEVAAELRQAVTEDVERFTGLGVDRVDVDITTVEPRTSHQAEATHRPVVPAAKAPAAGPAAWGVGVVGALVLVGVGGVGVAEMLRATGLLRGRVIPDGWFGRAVVVEPGGWLRSVGIAVIVVGLVLLVVALKPRRRTHLAVGEIVWIRPAAAARLAADSAGKVDSVTAASVVAKRRRLQATVTTFGDPSRVHDEVGTAIADRLSTVTPKPRVRVDLRED
ncbi:Asp23/Gls24 family envelope stress response protein [Kribbella sp. NPDC059898]|uniref:Asp23/Gls24 family envelope stress response protein n=1 Tax=Kribbella sp. NPDC059898 TaxID=3346995 RepID=UPI003654444D